MSFIIPALSGFSIDVGVEPPADVLRKNSEEVESKLLTLQMTEAALVAAEAANNVNVWTSSVLSSPIQDHPMCSPLLFSDVIFENIEEIYAPSATDLQFFQDLINVDVKNAHYSRTLVCKGTRRPGARSEMEKEKLLLLKQENKPAKRRKRMNPTPCKIGHSALRKIVGPTKISSVVPTHINEMQAKVLNHLSAVLPLECRVYVAGTWNPFILVGVLYRYNNLTWLIMSRSNHKVYLGCHWISDTKHLFETLRPNIRLDSTNAKRKFNRQGFNQVCIVYQTFSDYTRNTGVKLSCLPSFILRVEGSEYCLRKIQDFINTNSWVNQFRAPKQHASWVSMLPPSQLEFTRGWRMFGCTKPLSGKCGGVNRRSVCLCEKTAKLIRKPSLLAYVDAISQICFHCPTSLDKPQCRIPEFFSLLSQHVKLHKKAEFFPV